jgi:hypothetical protein
MARADDGNVQVRDALDHARASAQELHGALTDAVTRHGGVIRDELAALPMKARAIADSLGHSLETQNVVTKQSIDEAVTYLDATQTHIAEALKSSGQAAESLIQRAIVDARESVQKISEAVAARRSAALMPNPAN